MPLPNLSAYLYVGMGSLVLWLRKWPRSCRAPDPLVGAPLDVTPP